METSTSQEGSPENRSATGTSPAEVLTAYLEKSPIIQAVIRDLVNTLKDGNLPPEQRHWTERALQATLFRYTPPQPGEHGRIVSAEEMMRQVPGLREARERLEEEETRFAANLARSLEEKEISQAELAQRVGLGPSAIAMMLSRRYRPHRRTVEKIAEALGVELRELWPG
jgi:lambda repressor-like predicted transcriptional regulator